MGKLLVGHFGKKPDAESTTISLSDCHQRLGLKPSDFVSSDPPPFFKHTHGAKGRYLVFELDKKEIGDAAVWRQGYYLLPLEAADVLQAFGKMKRDKTDFEKRPVEVEFKAEPPSDVLERATQWADDSQPLFFNCRCAHLILRLDAPWALRKRWGARLTCKKRCQPPLKSLI
jgi:hypothetical protein